MLPSNHTPKEEHAKAKADATLRAIVREREAAKLTELKRSDAAATTTVTATAAATTTTGIAAEGVPKTRSIVALVGMQAARELGPQLAETYNLPVLSTDSMLGEAVNDAEAGEAGEG